MSSKHTPRNLIQQYTDNVATEKSTHPARKRRPVSQSPTYGSSSRSASVSKRKRTAPEEDLTPRHLIQGFIDTQDTAVPSTRKSKRIGELPPPSSTKVKKSRRRSSLGIPSMDKVVNQFTPRTMIEGLLDQGVEQTPEVRVAKGDKSVTRSSLGDLPNNEISFQPIEASFHENRLTKQAHKTRGDRKRLPINIVRRRSEKFVQQQETGKELEFSSDEEEEYSAEEQTMEIGREANSSRRKSAQRSLQDVSDTSAKDTSASNSPRKSLSHSRVTPSKRQSMASLKNVSGVTPSKSLSMSHASDAHLTPDSSIKTRTPKETRSPRRSTPRSNRRSGNMSLSPRSTVREIKVKSSHAMEHGGGDMIADTGEEVDSEDEGSLGIGEESTSKLKSRNDDAELDSVYEQSQNKSRRDGSLDSTASRSRDDSRSRSRLSRSRSRVEDWDHSSPSQGDASDSRLGSESKSRVSVKDRPSPKSRSMSKSKLAEGSDNEDEDSGIKPWTPKETRSPRRSTPRSNRRSGNMSVSPRSTVRENKVKSSHALERGGGDMIADMDEEVDSEDEGSLGIGEKSTSKLKSRNDDAELDSVYEQSQNKSRRDGSFDSTASRSRDGSRSRSRLSRSRSRVEDWDHSSPSQGDASDSRLGSESKSRVSVKDRPRPKSRSMSKSKLAEGSDNEDEEDDDDDDLSSNMAQDADSEPHEFPADESRSGRSSPRHTSGLVDNVYDFHDDSPSKKILGKLVQTLQQSPSAGDRGPSVRDDISDQEDESREHHTGNHDEEEQSDDGDDRFHGEPEESIIPAVDRETHEYYTPLRTPHLKKKLSSKKALPVVTSTPKPPGEQGDKAAKQKGRKKSAPQKKLSSSYMPTSVVKGLFSHFCPGKVSKDAIAEVEKASAQFWENAAKDLESYALHAHRKTIEESDVELLMKRQKFVTPKESLYCLVEKYLPLELRQEIIPISRSGNKLELK